MFTFSTVLITVAFFRFKLRPTVSLLFLTHFISSNMSSLLSTSRVVSSVCVMVLIFHVTFLIPVTISPTPPIFIMYSVYRLNRPCDKMQPYLTPFWIGNHSVVPWSSCTVAIYSVCRSRINAVKCLGIPTLLMLFHIFRYCTLSKIICVIYKTVWHLYAALCCPWFTYTSYLLPCPCPFLNPACSIGISYPICDSSCISIILRKIWFAWGNSAMVQLFVHFVTSFLGEGMKIDIMFLPVHDSEEMF